jgi:hypothetical protein
MIGNDSGARSTIPEASAETVSTTAASPNAITSSDKASPRRSTTWPRRHWQ